MDIYNRMPKLGTNKFIHPLAGHGDPHAHAMVERVKGRRGNPPPRKAGVSAIAFQLSRALWSALPDRRPVRNMRDLLVKQGVMAEETPKKAKANPYIYPGK